LIGLCSIQCNSFRWRLGLYLCGLLDRQLLDRGHIASLPDLGDLADTDRLSLISESESTQTRLVGESLNTYERACRMSSKGSDGNFYYGTYRLAVRSQAEQGPSFPSWRMQEAVERNVTHRQQYAPTAIVFSERSTNLLALSSGLLVKVIEQLDKGDLLTQSVL